MMTPAQIDALDNAIMKKRFEFNEAYGRFPTKLFLDRKTYLEAILATPYMEELNRARTFNGLVLYQATRIFGENGQLVEVA